MLLMNISGKGSPLMVQHLAKIRACMFENARVTVCVLLVCLYRLTVLLFSTATGSTSGDGGPAG